MRFLCFFWPRRTRGGAVNEGDMAETPGAPAAPSPPTRVPTMQRVLDNPFLLLFIGVAVPSVFYLMWGIMEIAQIPIGK